MTAHPQNPALAPELTEAVASAMADLERLYVHLHAHPELSMQETETAALVAKHLHDWGYEVRTGVGGTGVVGVLAGGEGPTVMLRADMDGLPIREETGLPYASTRTVPGPDGQAVPVIHGCGHDMHISCLLGAAQAMAACPGNWRGTLVVVFQPAEETAAGAQAMLDDGVLDLVPAPVVVLGQHLWSKPAGRIGIRAGVAMAAADSLAVTLTGHGGHGSMPHSTIDPVVMAAAVVLRLQSIVSREVDPHDQAVVTVGSIRSGTRENIIPSTAELKLNIRSFSEPVRAKVLASVERIVRGEAVVSGATTEPDITPISRFPLTVNDPAATARVTTALRAAFGEEAVADIPAWLASEDFGLFGTASGAPSVFWFLGGTDPETYFRAERAGDVGRTIPTNHSSHFAPVVQPTLTVGVQALLTAALV